MRDVVIVGAGPAGLSASIYTVRAKLDTLVISGETLGGLLTTTDLIDNYLGFEDITGLELAEKFVNHSKKLGVDFSRGSVIKIEKTDDYFTLFLDDNTQIKSKTVIYTAGSTPRKLNIPGEELSGVSYCATCDGLFYADDPVVVVGGGDAAIEEALYLSNIVSTVKVLIRGNEARALPELVNKLLEKNNVEILYNSEIKEIVGEDSVSSVVLKNGEVLEVFGVFISIGQEPNSHEAKNHSVVMEDGFIEEPETEGFFVAGDIISPEYRQISIAVGTGAKAGIDTTNFLFN